MDKTDAIGILLQKQDEYVKGALKSPRGTKAFHFGEMVGINKGYELAIAALTAEVEKEAASEEEDQDNLGDN